MMELESLSTFNQIDIGISIRTNSRQNDLIKLKCFFYTIVKRQKNRLKKIREEASEGVCLWKHTHLLPVKC